MAPGEGLEPSSSSSKPGVLPVTPSRNETISGHWDSNPETCADLALTPFIRRLLYRLSYAPGKWSRWKDLNRHRSIINRVLWPLSYTAMVDPTGLKPALHGLKGRCSVTRAPDQEIGCGGRIRTLDSRINGAVPYQLGYATRIWLRRRESNSHHLVYKTSALVAN